MGNEGQDNISNHNHHHHNNNDPIAAAVAAVATVAGAEVVAVAEAVSVVAAACDVGMRGGGGTVMHIPIKDGHSLHAMFAHGVLGCCHCVVEDAEAHLPMCQCMVAGGAAQCECCPLSGKCNVHCI